MTETAREAAPTGAPAPAQTHAAPAGTPDAAPAASPAHRLMVLGSMDEFVGLVDMANATFAKSRSVHAASEGSDD